MMIVLTHNSSIFEIENRNEIFERETKNLEFKNFKILENFGFQIHLPLVERERDR